MKAGFAMYGPCWLLLTVAGCSSCSQDPQLVELHNRGVGLMGQYEYSKAQKIFQEVVEKQPDWLDAQVNLGIAMFNAAEDGPNAKESQDAAIEICAKVVAKDPKQLRAHYCMAALLAFHGKFDEAMRHFQIVADSDPSDAFAAYKLGECYLQQGKYEDAIHWYGSALHNDPYLKSAYYGMSRAYFNMDREEEGKKWQAEFDQLNNNPQAELYFEGYYRMGPKANAKAIDVAKPEMPKPLAGDSFAGPEPLEVTGSGAFKWRTVQSDDAPCVTTCDIDGDGRMDLFIAGALESDAGPRNAVLLRRDKGYELKLDHPLAAVSDINAVLWGDYDNDDLTDVYFCRRGPNQLWRQTAPGQWQDVTSETMTAGGNFNTVDGLMFDADHDGDLDIMLIRSDGPNELLNNNRDGTFQPLAADHEIAGDGRPSRGLIVADLDGDRDADLIVIHDQPPHEVYLNDRLWKYTKAEGFDKLIAAEISAGIAADTDADGQVEIYTVASGKVTRWTPDKKRQWQPEPIEGSSNSKPTGRERLAIADLDGDGKPELIVGGSPQWQVIGLAPGTKNRSYTTRDLNGWSTAILDPESGPAVVGLRSGGPPVVWQPAADRYRFAALKLIGRDKPDKKFRSNFSGIGARVVARIDSRWSGTSSFPMQSGPGQSLAPALIGMGGAKKIDFVSIYWSDGIFQSELDLDAKETHVIEEWQRQPISCPLILVWNGSKYEFVTDCLGVGGLGYPIGPGTYAPPNPTENILFPAGMLKPRGGRYQVKLLEPSEEITYLDSVGLLAYDLPPGWNLTIDERMGLVAPLPTGEVRFYRNEQSPIAATNDRGQDVRDAVLSADLVAAPLAEHDRRFIGRVAEHSVTMEFAEPLDSRAGEPMLLVDGWVEYPLSQTVFAAWQAKADYHAPTLEARDADGQWHTVYKEFGYPAGMPRHGCVPLANLPAGTTALRLTTNQEVYWDRLSVAWSEPCPEARRRDLNLESALLAFVGFPERSKNAQQATRFDYEHRRPIEDVISLTGMHTEYGAVTELVGTADNALAIFGAGEEIHCEFAAPTDEPSTGWTRRIVLEMVGWCKDRDMYTEHGETVEPLPVRGSPSTDELRARDQLHKHYNTRPR